MCTKLSLYLYQYHRLYFSAHWCPPCRKFTPQLAEAYSAHKAYVLANSLAESNTIGEIEVIFISLDSVKSEFDSYRNNMPWLTVPFENLHKLQVKDTLSQKFSVRGIPALIVLDGSSGKVVTKNGRGEYGKYFKGEYTTGSTSGCILS